MIKIEEGVHVRYMDGRPTVWAWTGRSKRSLANVEAEIGIQAVKVKEAVWRVEIPTTQVLDSMLPDRMSAQLSR